MAQIQGVDGMGGGGGGGVMFFASLWGNAYENQYVIQLLIFQLTVVFRRY